MPGPSKSLLKSQRNNKNRLSVFKSGKETQYMRKSARSPQLMEIKEIAGIQTPSKFLQSTQFSMFDKHTTSSKVTKSFVNKSNFTSRKKTENKRIHLERPFSALIHTEVKPTLNSFFGGISTPGKNVSQFFPSEHASTILSPIHSVKPNFKG